MADSRTKTEKYKVDLEHLVSGNMEVPKKIVEVRRKNTEANLKGFSLAEPGRVRRLK